MRMKWLSILIAGLLVLAITPVVSAETGQPPIGTVCPAGFEREPHMIGDHEMHEHHIGLTVDLNQDGLICVRHLSNGLHVHVDNVIP